ncbi:MAG: hypothetical protein D8M26_00810 [Ignavibacteriae bacterium]|nr:hypothetical protein [Ignavibacteriota bacterium]
MNFRVNSEITDNEHLLRAVKPWRRFWKKNASKVSSAAFKEKKDKGFSVDRDGDRDFKEIISSFEKRFGDDSGIITLLAEKCRAIPTYLIPKPEHNIYHAEIHNSETEIILSPEQRDKLSQIASVIKTPPQIKS